MTPSLLVKTANAFADMRTPATMFNGRPYVPLADVQRQVWGQSPRSSVASLPYSFGHWAGRQLDNFAGHRGWGESGPWQGATQYGALGGLAGAGVSALYNSLVTPFTGTPKSPTFAAGALGSLLGGWFGHTRGSNATRNP